MLKALVCAVLLLLLAGLVSSQAVMAAPSNTSIITISVNSSYSSTVRLGSAYAAETYIVGLLGQTYFDKYVNLSGGSYYGNTSHVYFSYSVPFGNGSESSSIYGRRLGITVTLNGSRIADYIGPSKPFVAQVTAGNAISIAESYGLSNDTAGLVGLFSRNTTSASYYSIAWAVLSSDEGKGQNYYGIYVDALTGNVIGEFYYPSYMMQNGSAAGYGTAGNLSIFALTTTTQSNAQANQAVYWIIFAALVMASIIAWIKFKPQKKSRFTGVRPGSSS